MKKFLALMVSGVMLAGQVAFATEAVPEEISEPIAEIAVEEVSGGVLGISLSLAPKMKVVDSVAVIELYDKDGGLVGKKEEWVGGVTETLELKFDVPSLAAGDTYKLRLADGLEYLKYYDAVYGVGEDVELQLYE